MSVALVLGALSFGCAPTGDRRGAGEYVDDKGITMRVKTAFLRDRDIDGLGINVETFRGVVQLSGFAESAAMAQHAQALAQEVPGVRAVKNDILIRPSRG